MKYSKVVNQQQSKYKIPCSVKVIDKESSLGCTKLIVFELFEGLEQIKKRAFSECTSLEHVTIPSTVPNIEEEMFSGCTSKLKFVKLDGKGLEKDY